MRHLAGTLLLLVVWPLFLAFDLLTLITIIPALLIDESGTRLPVGFNAGMKLTGMVFN